MTTLEGRVSDSLEGRVSSPVHVGVAYRVTPDAAQRLFTAGARIVVAETDRGPALEVTTTTTVNTRDGMSWDDLAELVAVWRNRYPGQTYYYAGDHR
jgi:hypothetical protein